MRHAVFSDVHANLPALEAVLRDIEARGIESKFCCGDIVGYGAFPNECVERIREEKIPSVSGNHDYLASNEDIDFTANGPAKEAIEWTRGVLTPDNKEFLCGLPWDIRTDSLYVAHGSPRDPLFEYVYNMFKVLMIYPHLRAPITVLGHTHQPKTYQIGSHYVVNVGSVGQPRDGDPRACYFIIDDKAKDEAVATVVRVHYSTQKAREKIKTARLPDYLGERLALGA